MACYALKHIFPSVSSVLNYRPNPNVCAGPPAASVAVRVTQDKHERADVCCFLPPFPDAQFSREPFKRCCPGRNGTRGEVGRLLAVTCCYYDSAP